MNDAQRHTLSDLAAATGLQPRTIRSWIAQGLAEGPLTRGPGAVYPASTLERLLAARWMREGLGMALAAIRRELLTAGAEAVRAHAERGRALSPEPEAPAGADEEAGSALDYIRRLRAGGAEEVGRSVAASCASADARPATPVGRERPTAPSGEERPAAPARDLRPSAPPGDERPAPPWADDRAAPPWGDERPDRPSGDLRPSAPSGDERPDRRLGDGRAAPPWADERAVPPWGDERPDRPSGDRRPSAPSGDERQDRRLGDGRAAPPWADDRAAPPWGDERPDRPSGDERPAAPIVDLRRSAPPPAPAPHPGPPDSSPAPRAALEEPPALWGEPPVDPRGFAALEARLARGAAPAPLGARRARARTIVRVEITPEVALEAAGPLDPETRARLERCADLIRRILTGSDP